MRVFLEFVTDTDTLVVSCRDGWLSIYDQEVQYALHVSPAMHIHSHNLVLFHSMWMASWQI